MSDPRSVADTNPSVLRSSAVMASGTIASRLTGMLRDISLAVALGTAVFADTYTIANTIPNIIYILLAGGALNAVFIPQLVRHMRQDDDRGIAYAQRLLSLVTVVLVLITIAAVLLAPWIVRIYAGSAWSSTDLSVATLFARYCLPQVLFYGLFTMFSQVLNARGHFAMPMFAPIVNNVVVIATSITFIVMVHGHTPTTATVTHHEIAILGIGTTVGIAAQALVLIPVMRRVGFRWRFRTDWRHAGLGRAGHLAIWTFVFVLTNQIAYAVIARLATQANKVGQLAGQTTAVGFTSYSRAYLLFILPQSVVTVSIVTALLPRMSRAAHEGDLGAVSADVSRGVRLMAAAIVPAAVALFVLGPRIAIALYGYGATTTSDARAIGETLQMFVIGLIPFAIFYVLLRGFYAMEQNRTTAWVNVGLNVVNVVAAVALYYSVPVRWRVPALAAGYSISYIVGAIPTWRLLARRLGGLPAYEPVRTLVRLSIAALLGGAVTYGLAVAVSAVVSAPRLSAILGTALGLAGGGLVFGWVAHRMRVEEIDSVLSLLRARLAR